MQSTNIPSKIPLPFGYAAGGSYINTIPSSSQIGVVNGRASLHDGFPPLNFTPISSGGVPPFGGDMNGILNEITAIQQWQEAGGFFPFDASFASTISGYPKGAILQSSSFNGLWVSTIENNSNNPDTTGTGWKSLAFEGLQAITMSGTSVTLTNIQSAYPVINVTGTLTTNSTLLIPAQVGEWIIANNTTGSYTLTVQMVGGSGVALTQGYSTYTYADGTNVYYANSAQVSSFNGRTGFVTLNSADVTSALGFTPISAISGLGFGGTTWKNVTSSRASGVTYTNSYSYPIVVSAGGSASYSPSPSITIYVNGILVSNYYWQINSSGAESGGFTIVPPGATYQLNFNGSGISFWSELY